MTIRRVVGVGEEQDELTPPPRIVVLVTGPPEGMLGGGGGRVSRCDTLWFWWGQVVLKTCGGFRPDPHFCIFLLEVWSVSSQILPKCC